MASNDSWAKRPDLTVEEEVESVFHEDKPHTWKPALRKATVREAATHGNVELALEMLEATHDPEEAKELARYAKVTASNKRQMAFLNGMQEELGIAWGTTTGAKVAPLGPPPKPYDPATGQILTGQLATVMLDVVAARHLPVMDGATGSCDPFVKMAVLTAGHDQHAPDVRSRDWMTSIKGRNRNPVWNESFEIPLHSLDAVLDVELTDWDEDGTHDLIGG